MPTDPTDRAGHITACPSVSKYLLEQQGQALSTSLPSLPGWMVRSLQEASLDELRKGGEKEMSVNEVNPYGPVTYRPSTSRSISNGPAPLRSLPSLALLA